MMSNRVYKTGKQIVAEWEKKESMRKVLDIASAIKRPATEVAMFVTQLDTAGYEIRPKGDQL